MGGKKSTAGMIAGAALGVLLSPATGGSSLALMGSTAAGWGAVGGAVGAAGGSMLDASDTSKAMKSAAANANAQAQAQAKALKDAQDTASSQAQAAVNSRRARYAASNTIFTNPLGIAGLASTAKKTLLGQ